MEGWKYPMAFELQLGGKGANPQELTQVSDWGAAPAANNAAV